MILFDALFTYIQTLWHVRQQHDCFSWNLATFEGIHTTKKSCEEWTFNFNTQFGCPGWWFNHQLVNLYLLLFFLGTSSPKYIPIKPAQPVRGDGWKVSVGEAGSSCDQRRLDAFDVSIGSRRVLSHHYDLCHLERIIEIYIVVNKNEEIGEIFWWLQDDKCGFWR